MQNHYIIYMSNNQIWRAENINTRLLDVKAVAQQMSICIRGVWRLVARGELPPPVRIGRCRRWFEADIVAVKRRLVEERNWSLKR